MIAPVKRLTKKEIDWLASHRCKHNHSYLEHYNCYLKENPKAEKIGFFDIEAYSYGRSFRGQDGLILCVSIKPIGGKVKTFVNKDIMKLDDKKVVKQVIEELSTYDKIFTYNGTRYDLPYIRTRAVINKLDFLGFGDLLQRDLYYVVRNKLSLKRSSQEQAGIALLGKSNKTTYSPKLWMQAMQGNKKAINLIADHCERDVSELERIYHKIKKFTKTNSRSV